MFCRAVPQKEMSQKFHTHSLRLVSSIDRLDKILSNKQFQSMQMF